MEWPTASKWIKQESKREICHKGVIAAVLSSAHAGVTQSRHALHVYAQP